MSDAMDWRSPHEDVMTFQMVDPSDHQTVRGTIEGVSLSDSSLTMDYESDTRICGQIKVRGDSFVRGSMVRIIHSVPEWGYTNVLGTFLVTDGPRHREKGIWDTTLTLSSALYGLSTDKTTGSWYIGAGATAICAADQIMTLCRRPHRIAGACHDYRFCEPKAYDAQASFLDIILSLADFADDRVVVEGDGAIVWYPYVAPKQRTPMYTFDLADPRDVTLDGVDWTTDWYTLPGRVVVTGGSGDATIYGSADAPATSPASSWRRGWMITDVRQVDDMQPATGWRANEIAAQTLSRESYASATWTLKTIYVPLTPGDVVWLVTHDGEDSGRHLCEVRSISPLSLDKGMTQTLALKEVG